MSPFWSPEQYGRFGKERLRPFVDLLARVPDADARSAADLGCGTAEPTRLVCARWPAATVWGVDTSAEMLARAADLPPNLRLVRADLATWDPPVPLDLIVSNAALHWVPDQEALLRRLAGLLSPRGILAVQIPNNRGEPAYAAARDLLEGPSWRRRLPNGWRDSEVAPAAWYSERLADLGLEADVWETTYLHRLASSAAIAEWLRGSTLRPAFTGADPEDEAAFTAELGAALAADYPATRHGAVFPFRRLFFVAAKR